jgi:N-acetylglucosaminyldiphosphoundecaprenol N-acetyl-beta-D-mannosaminyltransferase
VYTIDLSQHPACIGGDGLKSVSFGPIRADAVTRHEALQKVEEMVQRCKGGVVFTPNVDHVVLADANPSMRAAYSRANLALADGMPLLWAARLLRTALPEKVSGSDFVPFILEYAAKVGWKVYFLGGGAGIAARARDRVSKKLPSLHVVGVDAPDINLNDSSEARAAIVGRIRTAGPDLVFVALGAPKQELWIDLVRDDLCPAVLLGVGGTLDFLSGNVRRAPLWVSRVGLEWLFRLFQEPRRLWRRYLLRDPKFLVIVGRALIRQFRQRRKEPITA